MTGRTVVAGFVLLLLALSGVQNADATALGLADGTYNIALNFSGTTFDATGTITITSNSNPITALHVTTNSSAKFDCSPCTVFSSTPDFVSLNSTSGINITDLSGGNLFIGAGSALFTRGFTLTSGAWTTTAVAEPAAAWLILTGLGALAVIRRTRRH
jgi:hypothetical protein